MLGKGSFHRLYQVSQPFLRRNDNHEIVHMVAKLTDDLLIAGSFEEMKYLPNEISQRFRICETIIDDEIKLYGCTICQSECFDIYMAMKEYYNSIKPLNINIQRHSISHDVDSDYEKKTYRQIEG